MEGGERELRVLEQVRRCGKWCVVCVVCAYTKRTFKIQSLIVHCINTYCQTCSACDAIQWLSLHSSSFFFLFSFFFFLFSFFFLLSSFFFFFRSLFLGHCSVRVSLPGQEEHGQASANLSILLALPDEALLQGAMQQHPQYGIQYNTQYNTMLSWHILLYWTLSSWLLCVVRPKRVHVCACVCACAFGCAFMCAFGCAFGCAFVCAFVCVCLTI